MNWDKWLNVDIECGCGRIHRCDMLRVQTGSGALLSIPETVELGGFSLPLVVSDVNTEDAAGAEVKRILKGAGIAFRELIYPSRELIPDERAQEELFCAARDCGLIIGVGSGTINDLCKHASFHQGKECFIVTTAPSMDGYASSVAALITAGLKVTYEVHKPCAVFADTKVLKHAPAIMTAAGVGDIMGKYISLADWKLSHIVTGEYFCQTLYDLLLETAQRVERESAAIASGSEEAFAGLIDALIFSGVIISYMGNSRAASGSEHHLSHFLELIYQQRREHIAEHGIKVGVGSVVCAGLYSAAVAKAPLPQKPFDVKSWEAEIRRVYGPAAQGVIELEQKADKNGTVRVAKRLAAVRANDIAGALAPDMARMAGIERALKRVGAPTSPVELHVDRATMYDCVRYAKELRNRYGVLQFLCDAGSLSDAAAAEMERFYGERT